MQIRKFLFTISSLEWILHSLYQGCVFSKIWRELGFVHYIKYFTISRFTISRLGCTFFFCSLYRIYITASIGTILWGSYFKNQQQDVRVMGAADCSLWTQWSEFIFMKNLHLLFLHSDDIIRLLEQNGWFLNKSAISFWRSQ